MTEQWTTITSHPASGLAYQELDGTARVILKEDGTSWEIVSPSSDTDGVYRQYNGRVQRAIERFEQEDTLWSPAADLGRSQWEINETAQP